MAEPEGGGASQSTEPAMGSSTGTDVSLREHVEARLTDMHAALAKQLQDALRMLQERYETQTKAVDAAFLAQQTAMQTALSAAEKAVETALLSAEKAVTKAELAADKRFESVNEFRSQLADQAATLISRAEADARFNATSEVVTETKDRVSKLEAARANRAENRTEQRLNMGAVVGVVAASVGLLSLVAAVVFFVASH